MISLAEYRFRIGSYCSVARRMTFRSQNLLFEKYQSAKEEIPKQSFLLEMLRFRAILFFIVFLCVTVYTNYQQLLPDGDIESNSDPFRALKPIFGSFNQGDTALFGNNAGIQCAYNSLISIC